MAFDKNSKMFFLSAIDGLRDPVRNTKWRMLIPSNIFAATGIKPTNGLDFGTGEEGTDDFALHIDNASIPEIKTSFDSINWMGFKSAYPTGADISADIKFKSKLLEDFRAYEAMLAWQNNLYNTGILVDSTGNDRVSGTGLALGLGAHKDMKNTTSQVLRNSTMKIELYNWMRGDVMMRLSLHNAFPLDVGGWDLEHGVEGKLVNFDFTLHCDRWTVYIPDGYATGKLS